MIGEMIIWGFFSAIGWMGANWTVNKIFPDTPPAQVQTEKKEEKKNDQNYVCFFHCVYAVLVFGSRSVQNENQRENTVDKAGSLQYNLFVGYNSHTNPNRNNFLRKHNV